MSTKQELKIVVAGGRYFQDEELLFITLDSFIKHLNFEYSITIIAGEARGADALAKKYAYSRDNIDYLGYPADWAKHGKAAGPIRNAEMAKEGDILFAFWDGRSRGTANMIKTAERKMGKNNVYVVNYE